MPPKRKTSSPSSRLDSSSPATPSNAQLAEQREYVLANGAVVAAMDSSPLPPTKVRVREDVRADDSGLGSEVLSAASDAESGGAAETQGMLHLPPKKGATRKRKADAAAITTTSAGGDGTEPKKRRKASAVPKKTAAQKRAVKTPKIVVDNVKGEDISEVKLEPLAPLTKALRHKVRAVEAFLDAHPSPLITREEGGNGATVDELDLLAALIILRTDYQLYVSCEGAECSFEDAGEMIIARLESGKVSVDFNRTCDAERKAQEKLACRGTGLEAVNLVEVELEMLAAKRKQLVEDGEPAAGFRAYGELEEEAGIEKRLLEKEN